MKRSRDDIASGIQISLQSGEITLNFKENCLFCGHIDTFDSKHHRGHKLIPVRSLDFQETIIQQCKNMNNKWLWEVMARISSVHDLPAADVMYHQIPYSGLFSKKKISNK